jgi:hypothetical protein
MSTSAIMMQQVETKFDQKKGLEYCYY